MAKDKDKGKEDESFEGRKTKLQRSRWLLTFSLLLTAFVLLPSSIVLSVCMIPTMIAAYIDRQPQRTAWITVGAMNFAGSLPAWFRLLQEKHTVDAALEIVTQPMLVMIAYCGATLGWMIYGNVTPLVSKVAAGRNERRLKEIGKRLKELQRKWGDEVVKNW